MAAASISRSGSAVPDSTLEDYSIYSNLSDDQLMQLAIERSLTDTHCGAPTTTSNTITTTQPPLRVNIPNTSTRNTNQPSNSSHNPPAAQPTAHYSSPNPPVEKPPDMKTFDGTVSRFMTGTGKRMVAYRGAHGGLIHIAPEPEEEEEPLFKAIREGDVKKVKVLMARPTTNLMLPSKPGWLAVHQAAWFGQDACLRMMLSTQPGMVNKRTLRGETPLLVAASNNQLPCVEVLLLNGADIDILNQDKETPLYKACEKNSPALVAALLNHGASVNCHCIQGWTALHEAAGRNNVEICEMLVKAGAKHNLRNMYGITPLFTAAQTGQLDTLRFLLKHGT